MRKVLIWRGAPVAPPVQSRFLSFRRHQQVAISPESTKMGADTLRTTRATRLANILEVLIHSWTSQLPHSPRIVSNINVRAFGRKLYRATFKHTKRRATEVPFTTKLQEML
jgi:hypothetical protein